MSYARRPEPSPTAPLTFGQAGRTRRWLLPAILLFHAGLFYALAHGMVRVPALAAAPREVFVSLIAAPAGKPAEPAPKSTPKPRPVIEHYRHTPPAPVTPLVAIAPPRHDSVLAAAPAPASVVTAAAAAPSTASNTAVSHVAPTAGTPRTLSSGISYLRAPQPQYPAMARKLGEQGTVMLRVFVNDQGHPERVEVCQSSGFARLDEAARQAVLRALFKPYSEAGVAQAMFAMVPIRFAADA